MKHRRAWVALALCSALAGAGIGGCAADSRLSDAPGAEWPSGAGGAGPAGCPAGLTDCGGQCVATSMDPYNCGACGSSCAQGEVCSNGQCGVGCLGGTTHCGGQCVDTELSPEHCGACYHACGVGVVCSAGYCGGPPEQELEANFGAPVATGKYVWTANPASGRVAFINAETLEIEVVEAGNAPTYLAAVPDPKADVALVLNVLSHDATLLRAAAGKLSAKSLPLAPGANAWAVSPDGRWAIAWTDARRIENPDPVDGFQDVTVLGLSPGEESSTPLSVGYRPSAVSFDQAVTRAFAVSDSGVTVVDLEAEEPAVVKNVTLDELDEDPTAREVAITPDGAYALVRRKGSASVSVFSLVAKARVDVPLSGVVTDLDLSADGSVAVAVVRETGEVALLPVPGIVSKPEEFVSFKVEDVTVGSVVLARKSPIAILYTNAVPSEVITVFDSSQKLPVPRHVLLRAPVEAVFPTPDAAHAVVLHDVYEVEGGTKYPGAMSVVPIAVELPPKIVGFEAPLKSVAVAPQGHRAVVATGDAGSQSYELAVAEMPSLKIDRHQLASMPIAAGIVAGADQGYVAQEHPDGRITFVDFATGQVRTVTGFELASEVIDGSGK